MTQPIFVVSDLHAGDGGPCDNFAHAANGQRESEFAYFLDHVQKENGKLIVAGDLLDFWQANFSKVLNHRAPLLDRLCRMGADYVIGNHDIDLLYFGHNIEPPHPLFRKIYLRHVVFARDKKILIVHGHEDDPYCCNDYPDLGRASAIYTGTKERRNGSPFTGKYGVEARTLGRVAAISRLIRRMTFRPSIAQTVRRNVCSTKECYRADAVIFGHTHEPGTFATTGHKPLNVYNSGSWAESTPSFVRITPDGIIECFDWVDGKPVRNPQILVVK